MPVRDDGLFERDITSTGVDVASLDDGALVEMAAADLGVHVDGFLGEDPSSESNRATSALLNTLLNLPGFETDLISRSPDGIFTDDEINRRSATFKELGSRLVVALIEDLGLPYTKVDADG